jgi:hypothetical protein
MLSRVALFSPAWRALATTVSDWLTDILKTAYIVEGLK